MDVDFGRSRGRDVGMGKCKVRTFSLSRTNGDSWMRFGNASSFLLSSTLDLSCLGTGRYIHVGSNAL